MPVTVATSTKTKVVGMQQQEMAFYAQNLFWIFYSDGAGNELVYRTSSDGVTWSDYTFFGTGDSIEISFALDDDGYIHLAHAAATNLLYRRGLLNTDGTITWDVVQTASVGSYRYPTIAIDSDGYPWIGCHKDIGVGNYRPYVTKSSTKDGTWTTAAGFEKELSATHCDVWAVAPIPLSGSKVYVLYGMNGATLKGNLYDAGWGGEEAASTSNLVESRFSAIADDDDTIYVAFNVLVGVNYSITIVERTGGAWGTELKSASHTHRPVPQLALETTFGVIYLFWSETDEIKFARKIAGTWSGTEWVTGEGTFPEGGGARTELKSFKQKHGRYIGVFWPRGTASPYDLRCNVLVFLPTSLKSPCNTGL